MRPTIIQGGKHVDHRGTLSFVNGFDFDGLQRFYILENDHCQVIRAWQGHKRETKYFYVSRGRFLISLVAPDNWEKPSRDLSVLHYEIGADDSQILKVPGGHANGFQAMEEPSQVIVFSDSNLEESGRDNFRWEPDYFTNAKWIKP